MNRMIRVSLIEKLRFEQRLKGGKEVNQDVIWEEYFGWKKWLEARLQRWAHAWGGMS